MSAPTADQVIATLTEIGDAVWQATRTLGYLPECCIVATGAARRLVDKEGWRSSPVAVRVMVGNAEALRSIMAGEDLDFDAGAWTVGVDDRAQDELLDARMDPAIAARLARSGRFRAHLVLLVHTGAGDFLLDAAAAQFDRPAKDLSVSAIAVPVTPMWSQQQWMVHQFTSGVFVRYEQIPGRSQDHRAAPDWDAKRHRKIAALATRIREGDGFVLAPAAPATRPI